MTLDLRRHRVAPGVRTRAGLMVQGHRHRVAPGVRSGADLMVQGHRVAPTPTPASCKGRERDCVPGRQVTPL